ncbi:hypothetical protein SLS59_008819 [Nothophoma quercina]|uniref:Uncharacterized protein n=1 Tax=Nothophoma quercina TaxID=749835 RepID=A0ABR3QPX5_9PLEO
MLPANLKIKSRGVSPARQSGNIPFLFKDKYGPKTDPDSGSIPMVYRRQHGDGEDRSIEMDGYDSSNYLAQQKVSVVFHEFNGYNKPIVEAQTCYNNFVMSILKSKGRTGLQAHHWL